MTQTISPNVFPCGGWRAGAGCLVRIEESGSTVTFSVRGSAYGEARAVSATELKADWHSTELHGEIPEIGPVIFKYREDRSSSVAITSKHESGEPFFPAHAAQTLFYEVLVLDRDGNQARLLRNEEPMELLADIDGVPPNGTSFETPKDVVFVDPAAGSKPVFTMLAGSPGAVDDPGGLEIRLAEDEVDAESGQFSGRFEVTGPEGARPDRITVFTTPVGGAKLASPRRAVAAEFTEDLGFPVDAAFDPGEENPGVIFHAFATEGDPAEAHIVHMFAR